MKPHTATREGGFTLIELMVGLAVGGAAMGIVVTSLFQFTTAGEASRQDLNALHQLQVGIQWLTRDIRSAETTSVPDDGTVLTEADFGWTEDGVSHGCNYEILGSDLRRTCDGSTSIVVRSASRLEFSRQGNLVQVVFGVASSEDPESAREAQFLVLMRNS